MIQELLLKYSCLDIIHLNNVVTDAPISYKMYYKEKRNGGMRQIFHPAKETKLLQYGIIDLFLSKFAIHEYAMAYKLGLKKPLYNNAIIHAPYKYSLHIDFREFFPSILPEDLLKVIRENEILLDKTDERIIRNVLFIRYKGKNFLSIGAPASPIISNIVMFNLDKLLCDEAKNEFNGVYSRYADDIWFSANDIEASNKYYAWIKRVVERNKSPKLEINEKKTLFCSRKKSRTITGLRITPDGNVVIPREKKRILRSLILNRINSNTSEKQNAYINGYLAFLHDVEPDYYNSLIIKYGEKLSTW